MSSESILLVQRSGVSILSCPTHFSLSTVAHIATIDKLKSHLQNSEFRG
jgi:hypothetical protein